MDGGIIGGKVPDDVLHYFVGCPIFGI